MRQIEYKAKQILDQFPIHLDLPASLSGHFHIGETNRQHIENTASIMRHLCDEFKIEDSDRDMLIAAAYLHDIGYYVISRKGKVDEPGWKYYPNCDYSRIESQSKIHALIGAAIIKDCIDLPRREEIARLVSVHMSHWHKMCPQPNNLYEYLLCTADYLASRNNILTYGDSKE